VLQTADERNIKCAKQELMRVVQELMRVVPEWKVVSSSKADWLLGPSSLGGRWLVVINCGDICPFFI